MRITANGDVGIGTINPQAKLAVKGNIFAEKIKVTLAASDWPDYVFYKSYSLKPLADIERFIKQNHHLPEVPSAAEVKQNGLDLGDNQATLLKKIEELTLYLIEQNKKIEELISAATVEKTKSELLRKEVEILKTTR
jgi:hypothetical protein